MTALRVAGLVLCGGTSRRMGLHKAGLRIGGQTLLARTVRVCAEVVRPVVVVAAPGQPIPDDVPASADVIRDSIEGRGPLQALADGMARLADAADACFACACDLPHLKPAFIAWLRDRLGPHDAAVPYADGRFHPLAAVYRMTLRPVVQRLLNENRMRLQDLCALCDARMLTCDDARDVDPGFESIINVNTPEDFERAAAKYAST